jgi:hypothetical protein
LQEDEGACRHGFDGAIWKEHRYICHGDKTKLASLPVKLTTLHAISAAMVMDGEICLGLLKKKPHDLLMDYGQRSMIWRQGKMKVTSDE